MSSAEFDAYATGRTITYSSEGLAYGIEQYLPGRQVKWMVEDGICMRGSWYPRGEDICFEYEDDTGPHCWRFTHGSSGVEAVLTTGDTATVLVEIERSQTPLECKGPFLGV